MSGRPGVLQSVGCSKSRHHWATEKNWPEVLNSKWSTNPPFVQWVKNASTYKRHMKPEFSLWVGNILEKMTTLSRILAFRNPEQRSLQDYSSMGWQRLTRLSDSAWTWVCATNWLNQSLEITTNWKYYFSKLNS